MGVVNKYYSKRYSYLNKNRLYFSLVILIMVFLGIGYAVIDSKLMVTGLAKMHKNTWDVHFENIVKMDGSIVADSEAVITDDTNINFTIQLEEPGDSYSFKVDVVNDGTMDAMLDEILKTGLSTEQEKYIEYTAMYSDGVEFKEKQALPTGSRNTILVTVKYKDNVSTSWLPTEDQSITLNLKGTYIQDDGTSIDRVALVSLYDLIIAQNQENGIRILDDESSTYVGSENGMDFDDSSSSSNGQGVYVRSGTENYLYPIYYYRGAVENNNVFFAGYCWKIVRTTDTGGIKLVYNGEMADVYNMEPAEFSMYANVSNDATYPYTYVSSTKQWVSTNKTNADTGTIVFSVATPGDYQLNYKMSSETNYDKAYFYLDDVQIGVYSGTETGTIDLGEIGPSNRIKVEYTKDESDSSGDDTVSFSLGVTTGTPTKSCANFKEDSQIGKSAFNSTYNYNAYVGYMYGTPNSSTYEAEHLSTKTTTSSTIKTYIDTWYSENMTGYTNYLEDTVWCNDRSIVTFDGVTGTGRGNVTTYFGPASRHYNAPPVGPDLECPNQNDRFTVEVSSGRREDGNGALTYPVGLLTADELKLSGICWDCYRTTSYLNSGTFWWTMSPNFYDNDTSAAFGLIAYDSGDMGHDVMRDNIGVRPSVSLKTNTLVLESGDGSATKPFVVE